MRGFLSKAEVGKKRWRRRCLGLRTQRECHWLLSRARSSLVTPSVEKEDAQRGSRCTLRSLSMPSLRRIGNFAAEPSQHWLMVKAKLDSIQSRQQQQQHQSIINSLTKIQKPKKKGHPSNPPLTHNVSRECNPDHNPTVEMPLQNCFPQESSPSLKGPQANRRLPVRVGCLPRGSNEALERLSPTRLPGGERLCVRSGMRTCFPWTITVGEQGLYYDIYCTKKSQSDAQELPAKYSVQSSLAYTNLSTTANAVSEYLTTLLSYLCQA